MVVGLVVADLFRSYIWHGLSWEESVALFGGCSFLVLGFAATFCSGANGPPILDTRYTFRLWVNTQYYCSLCHCV